MKEIERKFLVRSMDFVAEATEALPIDQGYLHADSPTVRVRRRGAKAFLTIKGRSDERGLVRDEYEYEIPLADAEALLTLCGERRLTKVRHLVPYRGHVWEVDVFAGRHEGLCLAEIELSDVDESFELPPWVGEEVTGDPNYYNSVLAESKQSVRARG